jgi:GH35 family endo-1,4-beta-xylanase
MGEATLTFVFEKAGAPYNKSADYRMKVGKDWKIFHIPFMSDDNYDSAGAQCNIKFGFMPQTVEVGGIQILNYGKSVKLEDLPKTANFVAYQGQQENASWRKAADERIEKFRKGDLTIMVRNSDGKPVINADISVKMKRHSYHFGAAVTAKMLTSESDDGLKYRTIVETNFNKVVFENDLKFGPWNQSKNSKLEANYNYDNTLKALQWLKTRNILVRGHTYLWGPLDKRHYPKNMGIDIDGGDWQNIKKVLISHIEEEGSALKDYIYEWDVINHPVATWGDKGRCWDDVMGKQFYIDVFKLARSINPSQILYINEGSDFPGDDEDVRADYESLISELIRNKTPVDGIGFMSHFGESSLNGMDKIYELIERYAKFGLKLQSTELDIGTGGDEKGQADYYRDFMTMFFSHPATVGIIMWGFWEGSHWNPDRALYRKNWEIKPCGKAWLDLVKNKWWTDTGGKTDATGTLKVRGFLGDYEVSVINSGVTKTVPVKLIREGASIAVVIE